MDPIVGNAKIVGVVEFIKTSFNLYIEESFTHSYKIQIFLDTIYKMVFRFAKTSNKLFRLYMADINYLDSANLDDPPTLRYIIKILNTLLAVYIIT